MRTGTATDTATRSVTDGPAVLKALADPHRWRLLELVRDAGGEACVCDLTAGTDLSQPTVSHHLRTLVEAGLLEREKRGVWAWYRTAPGAVLALREELLRLVGAPAVPPDVPAVDPAVGHAVGHAVGPRASLLPARGRCS